HHRVHPKELDEKPGTRRQDEIPAERRAVGLRRPPPSPEQREDREIREGLVDRGGMDLDTWRIGPPDHWGGVRHSPGDGGHRSPVAIAGELTADAADGLTEDEGRGDRVRAAPPGDAMAPEEQGHGERSADQAPVEHEAASGEEQPDRVADES